MGGSSELKVINKIKSVVESLTLWFWNNCMKVNPDKFHLLLSDKKVITWIFVMRSFQVRAVKRFSGLKLKISLLLKNTETDCAKKPVKKSMLWQEFHL